MALDGAAGPSMTQAKGADASLYLHPQTLARLSTFELRAKMIVEGFSSGQHRSPYQGLSVEFAQHRPYAAGDDLRHLDWKVFGRSDKLQLKQHQQETNLDLVILVDASGSMDYGSRSFEDASGLGVSAGPTGRKHWSKFDHATALAAALAYITLRQSDRVGLVVFADKVLSMVKRSSARAAWRPIVENLSVHPVGAATDFPRAIDQTLATLTNRCMLAVVSDFLTDLDAVRATLARVRHARHDLIAFQVLDRAEIEFDFDEPAPFEGLEGEARVKIDPRALRGAYLAALREHEEKLRASLVAFGFDFHRLCTHDWLGPALAAFVTRRNASMRRGG
ncbi:MAG: DUF58 domain-containing protein [Planctomycetota bacterium]|nr:DUF58 domain-containing protein [Planctomycetota bacterium]